jgi:hypothetical protein
VLPAFLWITCFHFSISEKNCYHHKDGTYQNQIERYLFLGTNACLTGRDHNKIPDRPSQIQSTNKDIYSPAPKLIVQ